MQIHDLCVSRLPTASTFSTENVLILFWTKLKTNISNWQQLSALCGISTSTVSRTFHNVLLAFNETVVPQFLGTNRMTRSDTVTHNTTFTRSFYGDKECLPTILIQTRQFIVPMNLSMIVLIHKTI